jgi:hypothetical protein
MQHWKSTRPASKEHMAGELAAMQLVPMTIAAGGTRCMELAQMSTAAGGARCMELARTSKAGGRGRCYGAHPEDHVGQEFAARQLERRSMTQRSLLP